MNNLLNYLLVFNIPSYFKIDLFLVFFWDSFFLIIDSDNINKYENDLLIIL